jgi:hypothetical protein
MLDPRELTNAETYVVCGGQANSVTVSQSTATPGPVSLSAALSSTGTNSLTVTVRVVPGLATSILTAKQSG